MDCSRCGCGGAASQSPPSQLPQAPGTARRTAGRVAVVTDSGCCLPAGLIRRWRIRIVPLRLLAGYVAADDGPDGMPAAISEQVAAGQRLLTSRPAPGAFAAAYQQAASAGAGAIVSVHRSGQLSGTIASAELALMAGAERVEGEALGAKAEDGGELDPAGGRARRRKSR